MFVSVGERAERVVAVLDSLQCYSVGPDAAAIDTTRKALTAAKCLPLHHVWIFTEQFTSCSRSSEDVQSVNGAGRRNRGGAPCYDGRGGCVCVCDISYQWFL